MKSLSSMRVFSALLLGQFLLAGCAANSFSFADFFSSLDENEERHVEKQPVVIQPTEVVDNGIRYRDVSTKNQNESEHTDHQPLWLPQEHTYRPNFTHKSVSDYAEQLAMQLMQNTHKLTTQSLVGIGSFVMLDNSLQRTNVLGNQLAELFIAEVQQYGMSVVDFKVTGDVWVTNNGDYVFSRDARRLAKQLAIDYILSGTMIQNEQGVKVNARIVSASTKVVMSSAQVFIPHFVVESLKPRVVFALVPAI